LFAPISIGASVYGRSGYVFTPSIAIEVGFLTAALFDFPRSHHYYFGDYYGDEYSRRGFRPWFRANKRHLDYDPIYAHQRWQHERTDKHWDKQVRDDYEFRRQHVDARPSRTYATQAAVAARAPERGRKNLLVAAPLREISARRDAPVRFEKIDATRRESLGTKGKELAKYRDERVKRESKQEKVDRVEQPKDQVKMQPSEPPKKADKDKVAIERPKQPRKTVEQPKAQPREPERMKISRSPVVGRRSDTPGGNPPARPEAPKPTIRSRPEPSVRAKPEPAVRSKPEPTVRTQPAVRDNSRREVSVPRAPAPSDGRDRDKKGNPDGKNRDR
jgi:hypothetical protein